MPVIFDGAKRDRAIWPGDLMITNPASPGSVSISAVRVEFQALRATPHPGHLAWAHGVVPTKYGDIAVRWWSTAPALALHAETPAGTQGTITLPATRKSVVIVNGRIACHRDACNAYHGRFDDGHVQLTVPGGRHNVIVTRG